MIEREIGDKVYYFNPLSFTAIEDLEKQLGYGLYKYINKSAELALREINIALMAFAKAGGNPIDINFLQNLMNENGVRYLEELVSDCVIQILAGQPKVDSKKKVTKKSLQAAS